MITSEIKASFIIPATKVERRGMNECDNDLKVDVKVKGVRRMVWCAV